MRLFIKGCGGFFSIGGGIGMEGKLCVYVIM